MNHSTEQDSQVVPHLATDWPISRLSAQSGQDTELSRTCGRGWCRESRGAINHDGMRSAEKKGVVYDKCRHIGYVDSVRAFIVHMALSLRFVESGIVDTSEKVATLLP